MSDETVALAAAVSVSCVGRIRIAFDGQPSRAPFLTGSARLSSGHRLLYALGRLPPNARSVTLLDETGEILATLPATRGQDMPWIDLDAVLGAMENARDRLAFLRQMVEGGASILKLAADERFRDLRRRALDATAREAASVSAERTIRLGGGLALHVLRGALPLPVESVQLQHDREVRSSPFKPLVLSRDGNDAGRAVLLTDALDDGFDARRIFLWGNRSASVSEASGVRQGSSELLPLVQALGAEGRKLVGYLAASLSPYLGARPELRALLTEMSAMVAPTAARQLVSDRPIGLGVDLAVAAADGQLFVSGWAVDPLGLIGDLRWIHPSGARVPLSDRWVRLRPSNLPERYRSYERSEQAFRFVASVAGSPAAAFMRQQSFEVALRSGAAFEVVAPPAPQAAVSARDAVLSSVLDEDMNDTVVERALAPAVAALQRAHLAGDRVRGEIVVGDLPEQPAVSIVVPLYKALEFLRYQAAAFATDGGCRDAELVLVLDSPEQADDVEMRMRALHGLYGIASRIVVHRRNLGYAPAVNTGVAHSKGDILVLMNSDIVPAEDGWLPVLRQRLASGAGLVGPKLLFHDDSIQHAGMIFERDLRGAYFNRHEFKGYPRGFPPANTARPVTALTGACLMLARRTFEAVGGFCEDYVVGDFEDSDFSLRVAAAGHSLWYEPAAELYHYERQSIGQNDSYTKTRACGYNRWLHSRRWGQDLDRLAGVRTGAVAIPVAGG